jgi:hypothetical protein
MKMLRLLVLLVSLTCMGCQAYSHWLSTEVVGCDPALLQQGMCGPRTAQKGK